MGRKVVPHDSKSDLPLEGCFSCTAKKVRKIKTTKSNIVSLDVKVSLYIMCLFVVVFPEEQAITLSLNEKNTHKQEPFKYAQRHF